jgi:Protein of unknown function (DUF3866)
MLELRRGRVVSVEESSERIVRFTVQLDDGGGPRPALAYPGLTGAVEPGDEVILNVEASDLGLGSGGFDILLAGHLRCRDATGKDAHVMKLNYTPLQHAVVPIEEGLERLERPLGLPVGVLALHGQLPCAAFALAHRAPRVTIGYVQTAGGALPGALSDTVVELQARGFLADHVTAAPCFGGPLDAITVEGALDAGARRLGWDCALVGPGPGILGSASALGHGGLAALSNAHAALSLGCSVVLAPRLSGGDRRERHRGLSHHTATVLELLLRPVKVAVPAGLATGEEELREALGSGPGHEGVEVEVLELLDAYAGSGLPAVTMGRAVSEDREFFMSALAAGAALADLIGATRE